MNELQPVWNGDVHGPDRGLLCALESRHAIQPPPPILTRCGPMIGRSRPQRRRVPTAFMRLTAEMQKYLTTAEATIPQLMARFDLSQADVWTVLKSFRSRRILGTGLLDQGMGRGRKVYWIAEKDPCQDSAK